MTRMWKRIAAAALTIAMAVCGAACAADGTAEISSPALGAGADTLKAKAGNIVDLDAGYNRVAVLRTDGVVAVMEDLYSDPVCVEYHWNDIVKINAAGRAVVGLREDGTVVASGDVGDISSWTDIVDIAACMTRVVGLKADGTVVSTNPNDAVGGWTEIVDISTMYSAFGDKIFGVRSDGTVVETGTGEECYTAQDWMGIVDICAGWSSVVGLRADGTVVCSEAPEIEASMGARFDTTGWSGIKELDGLSEVLGLKKDGTAVSVGLNEIGAGNVESWYDLVDVAAGEFFSVGLKRNGAIVCAGEAEYWNLGLLCG